MSKQHQSIPENGTELDDQLEHASKRIAELKRVKKLLGRVKLGGIRLLEAHCKLGNLLPDRLPDSARQETNVSATLDERKEAIEVISTYSLSASYEPTDIIDEDAPIFVRGRFLLQYPRGNERGIKRLVETIQPNAVVDSWPFWRELVQSLTVRMGIPPFPVPLVNLSAVNESGPPKAAIARRKRFRNKS